MPLKLIANTVWEDAARLVLTDTSDVERTDTTGLEHITGGQRWHRWTSDTTADCRIAYVNANAGLSADHAVLCRADAHVGHRVKIRSYATYAGTSTTEYDSGVTFAPTMIGRLTQDYLWELGTLTGKQGFGFEFSSGTAGVYTKNVYPMYFGNAFVFSYPGSVQIAQLPSPYVYTYQRETYLCDYQWTFSATNVSKADVRTFEALYRAQSSPVFLYDEDATLIDFSLLHGVLLPPVVSAAFNDVHQISFSILELRQWA